MSFNITKMGEQKFRAKVNYKFTDEVGKIQTATFTAIFKKPRHAEFQSILDLSKPNKEKEDREEADPIGMVLDYLIGWSEIEDEKGAVAFTPEAAREMMEANYGMANAFFDAFGFGVLAASRKN